MKFEKVYVLDTNIILDNAYNLVTLSDEGKNLIILPETVLDEIDSKKSGFEEINFQARQFGRMLYDAEINNNRKENGFTIIETSVQDVTIYIISKEKYDVESINISSSILNDRKILEIAKEAQLLESYKDLIFISLDVMARTRAISLGIPTEAMDLGGKEDSYEFIKHIDLIDSGIELENGNNIFVYDQDHKQENFSYTFDTTEGMKLAVVKNNNIELLEESELRKQNVNPMNTEQLFFSKSLLDNHYNIITAEAKAGSGKTLLAVSAAMELIKRKDFQRIVYIRNSVESLAKGEDVGYLSTNEAKFEIYNFPLFDTLAYIAAKMLNHSKENKPGKGEFITEERISEKVEELVERYQVETMWTGAARGRTISNAVVIIDEAQNMANSTLQLILTRIDSSCKVIVLGSNRQIDNQYITKYTNGLTTLLSSTKEDHEEVNLFAVELNKVLRGPITQFAEKVFSKNN